MYSNSTSDDKDSGNGFEFTRRKKWPQLLLQELVGSALFCLKPFRIQRSSMDVTGRTESGLGWKIIYISPGAAEMLNSPIPELESHDFMDLVYPSDQPHLSTFLADFLHPRPTPLQNSSDSTSSSSSGGMAKRAPKAAAARKLDGSRSKTTYARINRGEGSEGRRGGLVVWEIRAHATGVDESVGASSSGAMIRHGQGAAIGLENGLGAGALGLGTGMGMSMGSTGGDTSMFSGANAVAGSSTGLGGLGGIGALGPGPGGAGDGTFKLDGAGTVIPNAQGPGGDSGNDNGDGLKGKAVWLMGRKVAEPIGDDSAQSLDGFLELKLENEKLREELKELQYEIDDDEFQAARSQLHLQSDPISPTSSSPTTSSPTSSSASSPGPHDGNALAGAGGPSALGASRKKKKPGRPPKDTSAAGAGGERDKKRPKKMSMHLAPAVPPPGTSTAGVAGMAGKDAGGEGMHVCVTCGRTDSPEWRKGPLGPKTLCNACGLRWAKRNSTAPSRKEKKAAQEAAAANKR